MKYCFYRLGMAIRFALLLSSVKKTSVNSVVKNGVSFRKAFLSFAPPLHSLRLKKLPQS